MSTTTYEYLAETGIPEREVKLIASIDESSAGQSTSHWIEEARKAEAELPPRPGLARRTLDLAGVKAPSDRRMRSGEFGVVGGYIF